MLQCYSVLFAGIAGLREGWHRKWLILRVQFDLSYG